MTAKAVTTALRVEAEGNALSSQAYRPATYLHGTDGRSRPPANASPGTGRSSRQHVDLPAEDYSPTRSHCRPVEDMAGRGRSHGAPLEGGRLARLRK
jgi:hypothetical protein